MAPVFSPRHQRERTEAFTNKASRRESLLHGCHHYRPTSIGS